ncbi:MAG TPA: DUF1634 domain-containing protein [Candidatus Binataceae bacterium]|nr:DUF1634 domain-containing protein [Candidatus Binataceae bacterium]
MAVAEKEEEERILRFWTPILLRTILVAAMIVLVFGLTLSGTFQPKYFVNRYHEAQLGHLFGREDLAKFGHGISSGQPHSIIMLGLFVLTLVPLVRVAFCFLLFLRERDYTYVMFTAYVLAGLIVGMLLGSSG